MPTMTGSPRQAAWATDIRTERERDAREAGLTELADIIDTVDDAQWWIEIGRNCDDDELASALSVGLTGPAAEVRDALLAAGIDRLMISVSLRDDRVWIRYSRAYWRLNAIGLKVKALGERIWDALAAAGYGDAIRDRESAVGTWISQLRMTVTARSEGDARA